MDVHNDRATHTKTRQFRPYNIMVILAMSFGSYSGSIIGSTLAQPSFLAYFELDTRPDATNLISAMNGLIQAGAFFGALCISWVGDCWGRKMSITVPAILVVLPGALLAGSVHIGMFLTFRFFSGMGSFWLLGSIPVWMTEIVPPKNRGLLENDWRGPLALQALPALIVLSAMKWLPESPRYLIQKERHEEPQSVLAKLHKHEESLLEYAQIEAQIRMDSAWPHDWMSLITKKTYRKRALFAIGLACGIQFTGVLVINNYGAIIYRGLGFGESTILVYHGAFNTLAFGCGIIAIFPVGPGQNNSALKAAAVMTFCYISFAQILLDGTRYVYCAEIFPNHLRAKCMTLCMASISLMNVMWLQAAPTAFEKISWKFYLCFIIPAYLFAIVCFFIYPSTKGLALEEIAAMFGDQSRSLPALDGNTKKNSEVLYQTLRGYDRVDGRHMLESGADIETGERSEVHLGFC
ncbi:major facilitator superfamily domain-containing protein [Clohesyomyces aquaticus]|uniref:Major facilitator superfamily domain-containing protein n=1 Tax=Clohesyomyces aquaticus TaxID=1231657 RepID=A0A1Y1YUP2_9PLEO|nr:major facilitator superfamily domain-containing protein [Clohesyomyces aquaticus]